MNNHLNMVRSTLVVCHCSDKQTGRVIQYYSMSALSIKNASSAVIVRSAVGLQICILVMGLHTT